MRKKLNFSTVKKAFPLTAQNATISALTANPAMPVITAAGYQSVCTNQQQFYKPISKTLQF